MSATIKQSAGDKTATFDLKAEDYDRETFEAMREAICIESGLIKSKCYKTAEELFADNDAEIATGENG